MLYSVAFPIIPNFRPFLFIFHLSSPATSLHHGYVPDVKLQNPAGVDSSGRRKWDVSQYGRTEAMSEDLSKELDMSGWKSKGPRAPLRARDFDLNLEAKVGQVTIVTPHTPANEAGGFYCELCKCQLKDSIAYLDHINGKKHQRAKGMSMRPERSTLEQVKARLSGKIEKTNDEDNIEARLERLQAQEEKRKREKEERAKKKEEKRLQEQQKQVETVTAEQGADQLAAMGLPVGFGTSKKNK